VGYFLEKAGGVFSMVSQSLALSLLPWSLSSFADSPVCLGLLALPEITLNSVLLPLVLFFILSDDLKTEQNDFWVTGP